LRTLAEGHSVAMTADVPPGPARIAGSGIVTLARLSGRPIVPMAVASSRFLALDTWSRMTVNLPWSRLAGVAGAPIRVPRAATEEQLEEARKAVETALDDVTRRAYALAGGDITRATPAAALARSVGPPPPGARLALYRAATRALTPALGALLAYRRARGKEDPARVAERMGRAALPRPPGRLVWLHAASVGETVSALPLIEALAALRPGWRFLVTTGTVTSAALLPKRLPPALAGRVAHRFVPLDVPAWAARFLEGWRPDLAVFVESELWPNLIGATSARGVPMALVNARISARSAAGWARAPGLAREVLGAFRLVLAQSDADAERLRALGAAAECWGNLKLAAPPLPADPAELAGLRAAIGARPVFLAASTHPGEEEAALAAHRALLPRFPDLLTILAPRHPPRGPEVAALAGGAPRRSQGEGPPAGGVWVADTMGEMGLWYRLASVALVGGSLVPHGGQNPLEPARLCCPILLGPHVWNFADIVGRLIEAGGCVSLADATGLASAVADMLTDAAAARAMVVAAAAIADADAGLPARIAAALAGLVPEEAPDSGVG
jgi:3-deoxy-D-manno-octulosonic-acid transferase